MLAEMFPGLSNCCIPGPIAHRRSKRPTRETTCRSFRHRTRQSLGGQNPGLRQPTCRCMHPTFPQESQSNRTCRAAIFLVRLVPRRPKTRGSDPCRQIDIEIVGRKILFSPVARRNDDRLLCLPTIFLEIFDRFERHVVLRIAKIHERARVNAVIRNHDFDR